MTQIRKWADEHQFIAPPSAARRDGHGNIVPTVTLVSMNADPLGDVASMCYTYEGKVPPPLGQISDDERRRIWEQATSTHLLAPLEALKFHFYIEGVTRSFTHQMVRQRTAAYAQESQRFAVIEELGDTVSLPPSIAAMKDDDPQRKIWDNVIDTIEQGYMALVNGGVPSEDARGLLPHAVTTRLHYITDFRNLVEHAANRLCTQAQMEWRTVFLGIIKAIREYTPDFSWAGYDGHAPKELIRAWDERFRWQFETIAGSKFFRPVCYKLGKCPFQATFDRSCVIREQVDLFAEHGVPSDRWHDRHVTVGNLEVRGIDPAHWLLNPDAARKVSKGGGHD